MKAKLRITLIFLFIAATAGLLLRLILTGSFLYNYKYLIHTHSHIALLGWLYNAALIVLQYLVFKRDDRQINGIFWVSQLTFLGMLFSFPFEGYGFFSITFSTLYLFCSYYLVYLLFKYSKGLNSVIAARFIQWGSVYLVLSSIGPFALGAIMANDLKDTFWYKLSIYWFLHFLYNGFFVFIVFAYLINKFNNIKNQSLIFWLINISVIPLYALSILWLQPSNFFYLLAFLGASLQIISFYILLKSKELFQIKANNLSYILFLMALVAYGLKLVFQLGASFESVQVFLNNTVSFSIIGFLHLVMLGFFTLFFLSVFIGESILQTSRLLKVGIIFLIMGILFSESILFTQSVMIYFWKNSIDNYFNLLFWGSALMPVGIALIAVQSYRNNFK